MTIRGSAPSILCSNLTWMDEVAVPKELFRAILERVGLESLEKRFEPGFMPIGDVLSPCFALATTMWSGIMRRRGSGGPESRFKWEMSVQVL